MPSLAAHLGLRQPRGGTTGGGVSSPSSSSVGLAKGETTHTTNEDLPASSSAPVAPVSTSTPPIPRRPSISITRVPSRRGSLVARRNSSLANVADRLAEEQRTVPDEAFDVQELNVPDPPNAKNQRQRTYRQPDGSLSSEKPNRNPYAVAARRDWADLVQYARLNDGDANTTKTGKCFRHGIGVTWPEHALYLKKMNLEPETNPDGTHVGYDQTKQNPLNDPKHPFHAYVTNFDAKMARLQKRVDRRDARSEKFADEENDEQNDAKNHKADLALPALPWLSEQQRNLVQDEVLKSRARDVERGGLASLDTKVAMTL